MLTMNSWLWVILRIYVTFQYITNFTFWGGITPIISIIIVRRNCRFRVYRRYPWSTLSDKGPFPISNIYQLYLSVILFPISNFYQFMPNLQNVYSVIPLPPEVYKLIQKKMLYSCSWLFRHNIHAWIWNILYFHGNHDYWTLCTKEMIRGECWPKAFSVGKIL